MHTIVLATQKGGSGKTTLAVGLALAAIGAGHTVRLIETDPRGLSRTGKAAASMPSPSSSPSTPPAKSNSGCNPWTRAA